MITMSVTLKVVKRGFTMIEMTLCVIKPHAMLAGVDREIVKIIQDSGLRFYAFRKLTMTKDQAKELYREHLNDHSKDSWTPDLIRCATEGQVLVAVFKGENAVKRCRTLMGGIDDPNTIRGKFGEHEGDSPDWRFHNAIHGSDSVESAIREIKLFFPDL